MIYLANQYMKFKNFLHEPLINKLNRLEYAYYLLLTQSVYRRSFKLIGKGTVIRKPLYINNPQFIEIGDNVIIRDGVRLEVVHYNKNRIPLLTIGNNTNIEQNVHIICHSRVSIGANVSITGNCSIVDVTHPYEDVENPTKIGARILDEDSHIEIGDGSFVGFGSSILPNIKIGKHVMIGTHSVVMNDIPDYSVAVGSPAKITKRYNPTTRQWVREN